MRLWSLHPLYLDRSGLIACWREGLLALSVLQKIEKGEAKIGYRNHSQLIRFKKQQNPILYMNEYLHSIVDEAKRRGYNYQRSKLLKRVGVLTMTVTLGQIEFECKHLSFKLQNRAPSFLSTLQRDSPTPETHPLFKKKVGDVEEWERN